VSSLRSLAARRDPAIGAVRALDSMIKEQAAGLDHSATSARADKALSRVLPYLAEARNSIARAQERQNSGSLDEQTFKAECIGGKTVIMLIGYLESVKKKAAEAKDTCTLRCVCIACNILRRHLEDSLLEADRYPNLEQMSDFLSKRKIAMVKDVYKNVVEALDSAPKELGVPAPLFSSD